MVGTLPQNQNVIINPGAILVKEAYTSINKPRIQTLMQEEASAHKASHLSAALRAPRALTPLVLFMGFLGATLRYLLELALPSQGGVPYATLIVNVFGCFTLEIINQYVGRRLHLPGPLVKSLGIGLVGAFTTLSAFSTECLNFFLNGEAGLAATYITITITVTFFASLCGKIASNYLALHRLRRIRRKRTEKRMAKNATSNKGGTL